ncbi:DUF3891 family protein [Leeuwenhoekiella sp. MAR_2009_132]|uniref:DUF3891 family protein n=1 Tax=Leeuwenhoekiella sp. MAR_2009_132 TaxID=1392489 RepID=UPI000491A9F3|nr:DUF3891 family protein [Leeuwenhoekiella sp. MAR_2009_132]
MIVSADINGTRIITQTHHAHIACYIGHQLKNKYKNAYFADVIAAIAFHETRETDFNYTRQLNDLGQPVSFDKPDVTEAQLGKKAEEILNGLKSRSLLVAALVCSHLKFLSPQVFEAGLVSTINCDLDKQAMKAYNLKTDSYNILYGIVRFCDRLSLMICQDELPDANRSYDINDALGDTIHNLCDKEGELIINPWPFQEDEVIINYEYHILKQRSFKNSQTFYKAFKESEIGFSKIVFKKS